MRKADPGPTVIQNRASRSRGLFVFLALALLLAPVLAMGQGAVRQSGTATVGHGMCSAGNGVITDCGVAVPGPTGPYLPLTGGATTGTITGPSFPILQAASYGVVANTGATQDVALYNAMTACTAAGGALQLPHGVITLTGAGSLSMLLKNCALIGTGGYGVSAAGTLAGTTINLTSTTVNPFICDMGWSITGINFYWPNQTSGTTVYPPLISDGNAHNCAHASITNTVIINAYDGLKQGSSTSWGDIVISNSTWFAVHDMLSLNYTGDSFALVNVRMSPGPWGNLCSGSASCASTFTGAYNTAAANNSIIHATHSTLNAFGVTITWVGSETFAWRNGILIDANAGFVNSIVDVAFDGMGTLIDASASNANYNVGNQFRGSMTQCGIVANGIASGNTPCFTMGASSVLTLNDFFSGGSRGSFIISAGSNIILRNTDVAAIGVAADGGEYYGVHVTANTGGTSVELQNSSFLGINASTHVHGLLVDVAIPRLVVQNSNFLYLNDLISITPSTTTIITGNWSDVTVSSTPFTFAGTGGIIWNDNKFDKPPLATATACGVGCTIQGTLRGVITTGTGGVTSATLTLPFRPYATGGFAPYGFCQVSTGGGFVLAVYPSGTAKQWTIAFANQTVAQYLFFDCGPQG